jgi:two-component system NtrC family response regulator
MDDQTLKILIIDDELVICNGCRLTLSEEGYAVESSLSGISGLNVLLGNDFDIVLLDMKLPDVDGMEVLKRIRREKPGVYVIVMTGYSTVRNAVEAMKVGAFDYLAKPFSGDELVISVQRAADKKRLIEENLALRKELIDRFGFGSIVGENPRILEIFNEIEKVAPADSTVLLCGESGTGKELFARAIHAHSKRAIRQFVAVDCSTLTPSLLESELFGHVKGAFTGAVENKAGIFEISSGGTLFLDDVANLSMDIQAKLLRVLESHEYKPVGSGVFRKADVRIVAATNTNLKQMVDQKTFREDLYYRFNVFPIYLPPLRERKDDIPKLAYHFLRHFCRKTGKRIKGFTDEALEALIQHEWPGNVRQLKNTIERLVILADGTTLDLLIILEHLQRKNSWKEDAVPETLDGLKEIKRHLVEDHFGRIEKAFVVKALKAAGGNVTRAAEKAGMQRSNFHSLMRKHHVSAEDPENPKQPSS